MRIAADLGGNLSRHTRRPVQHGIAHAGGDFSVELEDFARAEQAYIANTAVLRNTRRDLARALTILEEKRAQA